MVGVTYLICWLKNSIMVQQNNGVGADALISIAPDYLFWMYVHIEEYGDAAGYLTPDENDGEENQCGTIYLGLDGIHVEFDDYPEYNGIYW